MTFAKTEELVQRILIFLFVNALLGLSGVTVKLLLVISMLLNMAVK
jgi:hypothetical protein